MKICWLIPFFSIISFLSIYHPEAYIYLSPWLNVVESIAMGSFFLLLCEFVSESRAERDVFFAAFVVVDKKAPNGNRGGLPWYRKRWFMIFQYPVVSLLIAIVTSITQATGIYCQYKSAPYFARLWLELAENISVTFAVSSIIAFWVALRVHLKRYKTLSKLLVFKSLVFWMWIASIVFWILSDAHVLKPSSKLTYADLNIGLPNMVTCVVMVPLSIFFPFAYPSRPYHISRYAAPEDMTPTYYHGGFLGWRAWVASMNPQETWKAIFFAFSMALTDRQRPVRQNLVLSRGDEYKMGYQNVSMGDSTNNRHDES
ncbi:hypothetical protein N431DRAFT_451734 [Stipitochalara longipes BDJ]|nr:hypothetical protein N431DRAFT_451734 [Stipitochalara longipes BDJ]